MNNAMSYNQLVSAENQIAYRQDLLKILAVKGMSLAAMSKDIGISHVTMSRFIVKEKPIRWEAFCRVVKYVDNKKRALGLNN